LGAELHRYQKQHGQYPAAAPVANLLQTLQVSNRRDLQTDDWGNQLRYEGRGCNPACSGFLIGSPGRDGTFEHPTLASYHETLTDVDRQRDLVYGETGWIQCPEGMGLFH
jgi:hypothetical protein